MDCQFNRKTLDNNDDDFFAGAGALAVFNVCKYLQVDFHTIHKKIRGAKTFSCLCTFDLVVKNVFILTPNVNTKYKQHVCVYNTVQGAGWWVTRSHASGSES